MTPERWQQIKRVLEVALSLEAGERGTYLDKTCAGDAELREEVDSLLASHQPTGKNILDEPLANLLAADSGLAQHAVEAGQRIGAYRIIEEIGRGGMGEVYRAVRADGEFTKEVALKTVRVGYDIASVLERFRNERQILAGLDHPNIARLYDGGTSAEDIPYLVMELVDGIPIDSYCDAEKLNITRRLELYLQVCSAVQYAHQRLVIHRDLKPGNILVTKEGAPKLLDFGIAKILDPATATDITVVRPMTPEYASPEQIRGEPITTASDVYSLGVVLYQLLTGRSPYRVATQTPQELSHAIMETEPERPSTAILRQFARKNGAARTPEQVSNAREPSLAKLQRRLSGDLDNILLKALRKEPQRRYPSVEQFAEDLRRHLEGRPVSARKDSSRYRAGKFIKRHTAGVAATALIAATLVAGAVATVREAKVAEQNRLRAEKRFGDVRKLSNSLIFEIHDSIERLPGATPARKLLLDRAVEYLDKLSGEASGDPELQRELAWGYQRLAVVQGNQEESNLGNVEAALASDRKALALFEAVAQATPKNTIDQLNVAMMHRILSFSGLMEGGGREDLEKAIAITDRLVKLDPQDPRIRSERSIEFQNSGILYQALGDRPHALESFQKMAELKEEISKIAPGYRGITRSTAMAKALTAEELVHAGRRKEALALFDQAIAGFEEATRAGGSPDIAREAAVARIKKCNTQLMENDLAGASESLNLAAKTIEPMAKLDPENSMLTLDVAGVAFERGILQVLEGRYTEANRNILAALKVYEAPGVPADAPLGKGSMHLWLGELELGRRNLAAALDQFQTASRELAAPPGKPLNDESRCELAASQARQGRTLVKLGKLTEAAAAFQQALATAGPGLEPALQGVPDYYLAADAYAGLGDIGLAEAKNASSAAERARAARRAEMAYGRSLEFWRKIPSPSPVSPTLVRVSGEPDLPERLAQCRALLAAK